MVELDGTSCDTAEALRLMAAIVLVGLGWVRVTVKGGAAEVALAENSKFRP